jgi:hypothetical protein
MADEIIDVVAGVVPTKWGDISGPAEWGLVGAVLLAGYGVYKFLSNSSVKAEGPLPSINLGNVNLGGKPKS